MVYAPTMWISQTSYGEIFTPTGFIRTEKGVGLEGLTDRYHKLNILGKLSASFVSMSSDLTGVDRVVSIQVA